MWGQTSITRRTESPDVAARPPAFWFGITAVTTGVILHLPMWVSASKMHYRLVGMSADAPMFIWGSVADHIGRRASILLAGVLFIATAICGAMPAYQWNFAMCFVMGLAAGGMLPIAFALISETMPARHRGWLMVLLGTQFALA